MREEHHRPTTAPRARSTAITGPHRALAFVLSLGLFVAASVIAGSAADTPRQAAPPVYDEHEVKAAFLYNFARFTKWPANTFAEASSPLRVCVFHDNGFKGALGNLAGKPIGGRPITAVHLAELGEWQDCHVLFIGARAEARMDDITASLARHPVLTVSDAPGFAADHGIIGLQTVAQRIRFQINVDAARQAGLDLSAQLLSLAEILPQVSANQPFPAPIEG